MPRLFLDVLGNKKFVAGYEIEASIIKKWLLKPGDICPFTRFRLEILPPNIAEKLDKAECHKERKNAQVTPLKRNPKITRKETKTMAKQVAKAKAAAKKPVTKKTKAQAKPAAKKPVTKKKTKAQAKPAAKKPVAKKAIAKKR